MTYMAAAEVAYGVSSDAVRSGREAEWHAIPVSMAGGHTQPLMAATATPHRNRAVALPCKEHCCAAFCCWAAAAEAGAARPHFSLSLNAHDRPTLSGDAASCFRFLPAPPLPRPAAATCCPEAAHWALLPPLPWPRPRPPPLPLHSHPATEQSQHCHWTDRAFVVHGETHGIIQGGVLWH